MSRQINLIPKITASDVKVSENQRKYTKASYVLIALSIACVGLFFSVYAFLNLSVGRIRELNTDQSEKLEELSINESILKGIETKLSAYKKIVEEYPKFPDLVETITKKTSSLISIEKIIVAKDGEMQISLSSANKQNLTNFLNTFAKDAEVLGLKDVRVLELEAIPASSYKVLLKFSWST